MKATEIQTFWDYDYNRVAEEVNDFLEILKEKNIEVEDIKITPIKHPDCTVLHFTIIYSEEV